MLVEKEMKVTIDIPDNYIPLLRRWASVSRTLMEAGKLLEDSEGPSTYQDRVNDCVEELDDLTTPLDVLYQTVRSAIWERDEDPDFEAKVQECLKTMEESRMRLVALLGLDR